MPGGVQSPMWEWWIVVYFFLGGVAGGAYFLSTIIELVGAPEDRPVARMGYYIAFPLAILCAVALIVDLGHPERFWHMMLYSPTRLPWPNWISPMSVGAFALLFFGLFSFLSFMDALVETGRLPWAPLRERYSGMPRRIYALIGAVFGFFITAYTGVLVSTTEMPIWAGTPLLGALFAASGAAAGMAAVALGMALTRTWPVFSMQKLRQTDLVAMAIELVLLVGFLVALGETAIPFLSGLRGILLLGGVLLIGLIVPLALQLVAGRAGFRHEPTAVVTSLLVLGGGFLLRTVIVLGGQGLM